MMNSDIEAVAREAVAEVAPRIREAWRGHKEIEHKGKIDLVTETDREVERLIIERLRRSFPDHLIVSEEAAAGTRLQLPPQGRLTWYLDPLDGTTNFAHGYPAFAISLALARGPELLFGLVHEPLRDELFVAHRGRGATRNGEPIQVSEATEIDQALIATGFPYDTHSHADFYLGFFGDFLRRAQGLRRCGAAALDLCYVACGRLDGFFEWNLNPWDTAAGALIVSEAGGVVTDFSGNGFDVHGRQTLASNGRIHAQMIRILQQRLACGA